MHVGIRGLKPIENVKKATHCASVCASDCLQLLLCLSAPAKLIVTKRLPCEAAEWSDHTHVVQLGLSKYPRVPPLRSAIVV